MKKITPFFWFENKAEEAASFYVSVFNGNPNRKSGSKVGKSSKYGEAGAKVSGMPAGTVMVVSFELEGQEFSALNGGPLPNGGEAPDFSSVSFIVNCENQEEVDWFWEKLSEGGEKGICGWIYKDKYGLTWQVIPTILDKFLNDPDPVKSERVMKAMLDMKKIEIEGLKKAYEQQ